MKSIRQDHEMDPGKGGVLPTYLREGTLGAEEDRCRGGLWRGPLTRVGRRILILGNAGSGKSTLARCLAREQEGTAFSLDAVAFAEGAERRDVEDSLAEVQRFLEAHDRWVIEGCYGDLVKRLLPAADQLLFLNPGIAACAEHCRQRPWEPDKYAAAADQAVALEGLLEWVATYETRQDTYGLTCHREVFASFKGEKYEFCQAASYAWPSP